MVLALSMLLSVSVSAEESAYDYELLYNLNIVGGNYESYEGKRTVSQEEFLGALVGLVTGERIQGEDISVYALSKNIISSIDNAEMKMPISYERALSLTLNVLGYAKIIEYNGQDISAVMELASQNKLTKGVYLKAGDKLDASSMITLLVNALEADVLNTVLSDEKGVFEKGDKNPLEAYREVIKITGKVTHTADTSLYSENGMGAGKIGIDDKLYEVGYTYSEELLGQTVYAYVQDETVLHVEPKYKDLERVEIIGGDILSVSDNFTRIRYENDIREKDIKLNPALTVIYNGKNYDGYTKADLMPSSGKIVCIDVDSDSVYDIMHVYSYETMVVKNVSVDYEIVGNVYGEDLDLSEDNLDVKIYKNGEKVTLSSIAVDNILSVAKSKSAEQIIKIYVGEEKITGKVYNFDTEESIVDVDGTEYEVNQAYITASTAEDSKIDEIVLGGMHNFYLDAFGRIAYVKQDKLDGCEYALIFKVIEDSEFDSVKVRILNIENEWEELILAEKVRLDGEFNTVDYTKIVTDEKAYEVLTLEDANGKRYITPHVALIKRDAEGKISAIREARLDDGKTEDGIYKYDLGAKGFTKTKEFTGAFYWEGNASMNGRHFIDYDTIILLLPRESDQGHFGDRQYYEFANASYFKHLGRETGGYNYVAYNVDEFGFPDLLVVRDRHLYNDTTLYVNKVKAAINEDGEVTTSVICNVGGVENLKIFTIIDAVPQSFKAGDVVDVSLRNGKIASLSVKHSIGEEKRYKAPPSGFESNDAGIEASGNVVGIDIHRSMLLVDFQSEVVPIYVRNEADIEIYDEEEKVYKVGSLSDIPEKSYVIIKMSQSQVESIIVWRR